MSDTAPKRRDIREAAVQFLYFWEISRPQLTELDHSFALIWEAFELPANSQEQCKTMVLGVLQAKDELDKKIVEKLENWELSRVHKVDLTILRLAIYEFYYRPDIPPVVTIDEAVELAKEFSNEESGKFINGILDKIAPTLGRDLREAGK